MIVIEKRINEIISSNSAISLTRDDFDNAGNFTNHYQKSQVDKYDNVEFEINHSDLKETKKIILNIQSSKQLLLKDLELLINNIRKSFENEIEIIIGINYNSKDSIVLIDLFLYR